MPLNLRNTFPATPDETRGRNVQKEPRKKRVRQERSHSPQRHPNIREVQVTGGVLSVISHPVAARVTHGAPDRPLTSPWKRLKAKAQGTSSL